MLASIVESAIGQAVGCSIFDEAVPTPFAYVDLDVLDLNLDAFAEAARSNELDLRPHVKTHKIAAIGRLQLERGAIGLTVAKLSEAEAFIEAGVEAEYLVAQPFWNRHQIERLLRIDAEIIVSVDSLEAAERVAAAAGAVGGCCRLMVVVDTGYHRFGVDPAAARELGLRIADLPGVTLAGIRSHAGHAYALRDPTARAKVTAAEIEMMSEVALALRAFGLECPIVSIGSTPGADSIFQSEHGLVTEARPGNYAFFDRMMVSLGVASLDRCAVRVVCEVISSHRGKSLLDGGKLTFSSSVDPFSAGHGAILGYPDAIIETLSQECATVAATFDAGQRLVVVPNHACEITNLAPVVFFGRSSRIEGAWSVDARTAVW